MPRREANSDTPTPRELDVLRALLRGRSLKETAEDLGIAVSTVVTHREHLYAKLGLRDHVDAIFWGLEHGLGPGSSPTSGT